MQGTMKCKKYKIIQIIIKGWVSPNSRNVGSFQDWLKDLIQSPEVSPAFKPPMVIDVAPDYVRLARHLQQFHQRDFIISVSILGKRNFNKSTNRLPLIPSRQRLGPGSISKSLAT